MLPGNLLPVSYSVYLSGIHMIHGNNSRRTEITTYRCDILIAVTARALPVRCVSCPGNTHQQLWEPAVLCARTWNVCRVAESTHGRDEEGSSSSIGSAGKILRYT